MLGCKRMIDINMLQYPINLLPMYFSMCVQYLSYSRQVSQAERNTDKFN